MQIQYPTPDLTTPHGTAIFMMRRHADPGLVVAYLEHEARLAGVDPLDLSQHPTDQMHRFFRSIQASVALAGSSFTMFGKSAARAIDQIRLASEVR